MNTAVAFEQETEGTTIEIDDKIYTVCDPTYENAPVGYLDVRYKKYQPGIIIFDKAHNYFNNSADQLEVFTPLEKEINTLHVVFSEKNISNQV